MPFAPITSSLRGLLRSLPADTASELAQQWPRAFVDFLPFEFLDAAALGPPARRGRSAALVRPDSSSGS